MAYLRWLLNKFAGNVSFAFAAYNAVEGAVPALRRHSAL